jgi:hypothetical protein
MSDRVDQGWDAGGKCGHMWGLGGLEELGGQRLDCWADTVD